MMQNCQYNVNKYTDKIALINNIQLRGGEHNSSIYDDYKNWDVIKSEDVILVF